MLAKHSISAHMSFCLGDGILVDDPKENGFLVLGAVKIPGLSNRTHYDIKRYKSTDSKRANVGGLWDGLWVELNGLQLGPNGAALVDPASGPPISLLDTGTSYTYLPTTLYKALMKQMLQAFKRSSLAHQAVVSRHTTGAPDQVLPILISKLMVPSSDYDATYLFMVLDGASTSGGVDNMAVLGNSFLSHIVVASDQGAKKMTLTPVNSCGDHPAYNQTKSRAASIPALCGSTPSQLVCGADSRCDDFYGCAASSCSCASAGPSAANAFFGINYGTGSAAGSMYSGALGLPGASNYRGMPIVFGCDLRTSGLYDSQNSGVFGLNYQPASMYSQMAAQGLITRQLSFCLGSGQAGSAAEAGFLILGDSTVTGLAAHRQYAIQCVPRHTRQGPGHVSRLPAVACCWDMTRLKTTARTGPYSNAFFDSLWVALLSVQFSAGGGADLVAGNRLAPVALFDTGTSLTYLPPTVLAAVGRALSAYAAKSSLIVSQAVSRDAPGCARKHVTRGPDGARPGDVPATIERPGRPGLREQEGTTGLASSCSPACVRSQDGPRHLCTQPAQSVPAFRPGSASLDSPNTPAASPAKVGRFQAFPDALSFTATRVLTRQQLDGIWPPLLFSFPGFNGSGRATVPISFASSILYLANSSSGQPIYLNTMQDSGDDGQAILGNTWTEHILLQSDQLAQKIMLTPLTSCGDVTF
ncbi:MAG: hypothetical protein WDW36_007129 [Sanguina aurantia]